MRATLLVLVWMALTVGACERQPGPNAKSGPPPVAKRTAPARTKDLTSEAFDVWLQLVADWHTSSKPGRLALIAKVSNWGALPEDVRKMIDTELAYGYRIDDDVVMIGGDEAGGRYSVYVNASLDVEALLRKMRQAFEVQPFGDVSEAGVNTHLYSLITGGKPVGIASIGAPTIEGSTGTQIGFASLERMTEAGVKLPPLLQELTQLISQAKGGDAKSQLALGDAYFAGRFGKSDQQLAADYWRMAADQGNPSGYHRLGIAYQYGLGTRKDMEAAIALYEKAADAGDAEGQATLGWIYSTGEGRPRNPQLAQQWLEAASKQGHAGAMNNLAGLFERGDLIPADPARSLALYRASAAKGYALANVNLGRAYAFGRGVPLDYVEAARYLRVAADKGETQGEYDLGTLYMNGEGVTKDLAKAADLFERAAKKGHVDAQNNIGLLLARGTGRPQDAIEGAKWWLLSSAAGNADATANLPTMRRYLTAGDMREAERRAAAFVVEKTPAMQALFPLGIK
jgi:TPR repeat protein